MWKLNFYIKQSIHKLQCISSQFVKIKNYGLRMNFYFILLNLAKNQLYFDSNNTLLHIKCIIRLLNRRKLKQKLTCLGNLLPDAIRLLSNKFFWNLRWAKLFLKFNFSTHHICQLKLFWCSKSGISCQKCFLHFQHVFFSSLIYFRS